MPFVDDANDLVMVQSDLQESVEVNYYSRESSASLELGVGEGPTPTVVTLVDHDEPALNEQLGVMPAPNPDMGQGSNVKTPASGKRGRPSQPSSAAVTPVAASSPRTPRSAKNAAKSTATPHSAKSAAVPKSARSTGGRKRKAEDDDSKEKSDAEAMPAAKRARTSRPSRTAGVAASARLAAKVANKPKRGRPKATATATEKKPKANKGGRPKKSEAAPVLAEFEVESILNMKTESGTTYYEVKWKGYSNDQNTWEPKKNLGGAKGLLKKFEVERKKSKIAEASKKASTAGNKKGAAKPAKPGKSVKKVAAPKKAAKAAPKTTHARSSGRPLRSRK